MSVASCVQLLSPAGFCFFPSGFPWCRPVLLSWGLMTTGPVSADLPESRHGPSGKAVGRCSGRREVRHLGRPCTAAFGH